MKLYVADTHALFWYLSRSKQLGIAAFEAFESARRGEARIVIPAIVVAELYYLNQKLRTLDFSEVFARLAKAQMFLLEPFLPEHVLEFGELRAKLDIHDCMIVCTTIRLRATAISQDFEFADVPGLDLVW